MAMALLLHASAAALLYGTAHFDTRAHASRARTKIVIALADDEPRLTRTERRKLMTEREEQLQERLAKSRREFAELRTRLELATERSAALNVSRSCACSNSLPPSFRFRDAFLFARRR